GEASLRDSQRKFALLTDGSQGIAFLMMDARGCLVDWNSSARRLFQYEADETLGRSLSFLYPRDGSDNAIREIQQATQKGAWVEECKMRRRNGSVFLANGVLTVLRGE